MTTVGFNTSGLGAFDGTSTSVALGQPGLGTAVSPAVDPSNALGRETSFMVNSLNQRIQYGVAAAQNPLGQINQLQQSLTSFSNPTANAEFGNIYNELSRYYNRVHRHRTAEDRNMMIYAAHSNLIKRLMSDAISSNPAALKSLSDIGVHLGGSAPSAGPQHSGMRKAPRRKRRSPPKKSAAPKRKRR